MNRIRIILFFLASLTVYSCNRPPDLTEDEINNILNGILAIDSNICIGQLCWKYNDLAWEDEYKKVFTSSDIRFINRQKRLFSNLRIKPNILQCYWPTKKKFDYFDIVDTNWTKGGVHHFSFPLISVDRNKVILQTVFDCNMPLCSWSDVSLYVRKNGKWKLEKTFQSWLS